ncbi:unnamed protein product [Mytilus coruscus]|uniref:Uncharacterized protein n=1 Tax=Mytilus coruscus TaxID=42192 RepID=A0A6J8ACC3_MYTCO|nr:unnamed protein product [Mytilus coruscus]
MPIGQRKLLLRAAEITFQKDISAEKVDMAVGKHGGNQQEDGYIQAVLQHLALSQKQHEQSPDPVGISYNPNANSLNTVNSNISWQDPLIYLNSANIDCKIVYNDISDFVSYDIGGTSMSEERLISDTSGWQATKSLSLCQWLRANLSIIYKLLSTGELTERIPQTPKTAQF